MGPAMCAYFERKIAAVLNNRKENYSRSKHFIHPSKLTALQCFQGSHPNCFVVKNVEKKTEYYVNMDIEICSCPVGFDGAPCKHQFAVSEKFNLSTSQFLPYEDEQAKVVLHQIMTTVAAKSGWYASLKSGPLTAKVANSVEAIFEGNPADVIEEILEDTNPTDSTISKCQDSVDLESQSAEMRAEVMDLWSYVKEVIDKGLQDRPDTFCSAVWKFASTFKKGMALSENAALSGLHNFTISSFGSNALRQGRYININRAAAIRRKYASLGGRKAARQGRPPKSAFTSEHGYSSVTAAKAAWDKLTSQRKGAVPHCLSERIRQQTDAFNKKKK